MATVRKRQWFTVKQRKLIDPAGKLAGKPFDVLESAAKKIGIEAKQTWIVDYYVDGSQHIKTFQQKKPAEKYAANVVVNIDKGMHTAPSKSITITEAGKRWIKRVEANKRQRTTIRQYDQHLRLHILPKLGKIKLAVLTATKVETFRDDLLEDMSRPMAHKVLRSLKSLLKNSRYGHLADGVSVEVGSKRKLEVGVDFPTPQEVKRMVEVAKARGNQQHVLVLTLASTGMRVGELRGLRWKDTDLKNCELHVRQRADRYREIGMPKSAAGARTIPIVPELLLLLKAWKLACPKGAEDLVYPSSTGEVSAYKTVYSSLLAIQKAAHVVDKDGEPEYGLHALRHFYASWCINRKVDGGRELPAKLVQELLGHSSIKVTLDTYGHLFPRGDDHKELAAASAALFSS